MPRPRNYAQYGHYKDVRVDWIQRIPTHWTVKRIKNVAPIRISKVNVKPTDVVYVGLEHIESRTGRLLLDRQPEYVDSGVVTFEAGDVLFGKLRPYLIKAARVDFNGVCTNEIIPLRPTTQCFQGYLLYALLNADLIKWLDSFTFGTKMPRLSQEQVGGSFIALPPLEEQVAIARFLDRETTRIDELVAQKRQLVQLLQEKRAALILRAVTKGLDPNVAMRRSDIEWLGEVPSHWAISKLKYVCERIFVGIAEAATFAYSDDGVPMLRSTDVRADRIRTDNIRRIDKHFADRLFSKRLRANDIVTVRTGNAGVSAVVPAEYDCGQCFTLVVSRPSKDQDSRYFSYWLNSICGQQQFNVEGMGTAQINISVPIVQNAIVCVPPSHEQQQISAWITHEVTSLDALLNQMGSGIERLKEFRTALISAAVTGQIDIRDAA